MRASLIPIALGPPATNAPRTGGIHVSSVLRGLAIHHGFLKVDSGQITLLEIAGQDKWHTFDAVSQIRMAIGVAWENYYSGQLSGVRFHPGEMCVDGIFMTPDGESLDEDGEYAIHEFKATYKSLRQINEYTLEDQWLWVSQILAYCKGAGCLVGYLHVLFLCGNYDKPIRPMIRCWRLEFTQEEIDSKWLEIMSFVWEHTDQLEAE